MEVYNLIRRKNTAFDKIMPYILIVLEVFCLSLILFNALALLFALGFMGLWYVFQARTHTEYEYSYFDGEIRIARITGKSRRKSLGEIEMASVEKIAPAGDPGLAGFKNKSNLKAKDYTSRSGAPYYEMIAKYDGNIMLYKLELDEKFINEVCKKYASKGVRA